MSDHASSSFQVSMEGEWVRQELRETEKKIIEIVDNNINKAL